MTAAPRIPVLRRLHVGITLLVLLLLTMMGAALLALARHHGTQTALEATQRLNLGLAQYIADHQPRPLITTDGRPERGLSLRESTRGSATKRARHFRTTRSQQPRRRAVSPGPRPARPVTDPGRCR